VTAPNSKFSFRVQLEKQEEVNGNLAPALSITSIFGSFIRNAFTGMVL
jgi:hypothetical protein